MIKRNLYYILYCIIWLILNIISIRFGSDCDCESLNVYDVFTLTEVIVIVTSPFVSILILLSGRFIYREIIYKVKMKAPNKFKIYSFIIVSIISLYHPISIILEKAVNESIKSSICQKSTCDISFADSKNLNFEEYNYIKNSNSFPKIPTHSKAINISYWEDNFLGEYSVTIIFKLGLNDKFNPTKNWKSEEWKVIKIDSVEKTKTIRYHDSQS